LEIRGVEALGEPAVDRCEELVGLGALALLLPELTQAHGRPQLPGFGLLAAGDRERLLEAGFGLHGIWDRLAREQPALDPICLRYQVAPPSPFQRRQCLPE